MTEDLMKDETFKRHMSYVNRLLEETKKDIDTISKKAVNDDDRLKVGKMIDAWEKACQAAKTLDEEIYILGYTTLDEND